MDSAKGETLRKNLYFHNVVKIKQPYTLTEPSFYAQYIFYGCVLGHIVL